MRQAGSASTPTDAFYGWIDIGRSCPGAAGESALDLLAEHRVAVVPGAAFGVSGEGCVRLSLAASPEPLTEGMRGIAAFLGSDQE